MDAGAEVDAVTDVGATPLAVAAQEGNAAVMGVLLAAGAAVNRATTDNGTTALMLAAGHGHTVEVDLLLAAGAQVNKATTDGTMYGDTALIVAASQGHHEVVDRLLAAGAEVNYAATDNGDTALIMAAESGHAAIVDRLLVAGAKVDKITLDDGGTALIFAAHEGHAAVASRLLAAGAAVDRQNADGSTALRLAIRMGRQTVAQALLVFGGSLADPSLMQDAISFGHDELANWLATTGAGHPLMVAASHRLHADLRSALRLGAVDPERDATGPIRDRGVLLAAVAAAHDTAHTPVCPVTTALVRDALAGWSPRRHWLHHGAFRRMVRILLLVARRLSATGLASELLEADEQQVQRRRSARLRAVNRALPVLPHELWLAVLGFALRGDVPAAACGT